MGRRVVIQDKNKEGYMTQLNDKNEINSFKVQTKCDIKFMKKGRIFF